MGRFAGIFLIAGALVSCAGNQSEKRVPTSLKPKSADDIMLDLISRLKLTEAQQAKVQPIVKSYAEKRTDIINSARQGGAGNFRENLALIRGDTEKMMAVVITEEQMKEYRKYMDEEQMKIDETRQNRRSGGGRGGGMRGGGFGGGFGR